MSLGRVAAALLLVGCGTSTDGNKSAEPPLAPSVFHCQKAANTAGVRACVVPRSVARDADAFDAAETWCITQRVSIENPRSRMDCVPTQDECERHLMRNQYVRSECARTTPDRWTSAETDFTAPDLFLCSGEHDLFANASDAKTHRCNPFTADSLVKMNIGDSKRSERAWCFEAPIRGTAHNVSCFLSLEECTRRAKLDLFADGPCMQQDARSALVALYGAP
jgi:hypothetical protein